MDKIYAANEQETILLAQKLAKNLKIGDVLCLFGDLGAGKTVFSREVIRFLSKKNDLEVPSPTFTLVQSYEADVGDIFHFDLYRLKEPDEVFELGWEDALADGISIIEWPSRAGAYLPKAYIAVRITNDPANADGRFIEVETIG